MTKQQKIDRIKNDGWTVTIYDRRTIKYVATLDILYYEAKNIYNLHKQIFGY